MTMTNAALLARAQDGHVSESDPARKPVRRQFSAAYKASILEQYEQLSDPGEKGALLRREGLYSSHIVDWRRARDGGGLAGTPRSKGPKKASEQAEIERLKKKNERLEAQLQKHRKALEIQEKASELLSRLLAESTEETFQQPNEPNR